ncbi:UvrD-helicase domain-containing protein [Natronorubrum texcoconense]|uniref:DNA 3'-5' helicase n=1 Tax=Natronorubrum texcoconense TaxID=1095776 RepID=A0A1G9D5T9_9EURY|nr:ATP-dependent DNA helicase [Natronorubrum texcoconense]SDK59035.1 ATP-dependent exoDNAse (exonuclease V) beta subunit (contains helicase and exonuclease domains) [Natronorubrum texcoconense]
MTSSTDDTAPAAPTPNEGQQKLIESTDGLYLVDAGAGTGKTFTVTHRYANIVAQDDVEPDDILLITFTRNAATEMKDRIVASCDYGMRALNDAPIQTFHSLCSDLLDQHGFHAPSYLGIDDAITGSTQILENETIEREYFREFIGRFGDDHDEYDDLLRCLSEPAELLDLINTLAAKGVFPTSDGWYRDSRDALEGEFDAFKDAFDEVNRPRNDGSKQSTLRSSLGRYGKNKCYLPDAPDRDELRGEYGSKAVPEAVAEQVFTENRDHLIEFVHDVYVEYLEFALGRNYLNFSFLQLFAFVLCCEDDDLRESLEFEYVMIDEFQDSSEIQFKLALLLSGTDNVCVVGDWKQSIYSFQYAAVENITDFEARLERFAEALNDDSDRISFPLAPVTRIELEQNYRSTQSILDFSEHALVAPGSKRESVDTDSILEQVVSLRSNTERDQSRIEAFQHADEHEAILTKIQAIVGNDEYAVEDDGELRPPSFEDIAVLTRTRDFGRELLSAAEDYEFPMAYEGGIELFRTDQAKLLLAWLRILEGGPAADRGWAVVLERAGYTLDEIDSVLEREPYPDAMEQFRSELEALETHTAVTRRVFDRYGYDGATADVVLTTIQSLHSSTTMTRGDLIRIIEDGVENGYTQEVQAPAGTDSVTVQTIHSVKGLEHPIVILGNMNSGAFPPSGGAGGTITYSETTGLRQRKCYDDAHSDPHVYDNWRADVLRRCQPTEYDEERRLLYVAMTRAEDHLLFAAGEEPNTFLEELPVEIETVEPDVSSVAIDETTHTRFSIDVPASPGPKGYSPHSLMDDSIYEDVSDGRGMEFGSRVHEFAENYALGTDVTPDNDDERNVKAFLDELSGELLVEERAYLPLEVDGRQLTLSGVIDLVHVTDDSVEIVDFKTDQSRHAESEYRVQLSVYYHVLEEWFSDRTVSASLFYTAEDTRVRIEPLSESELVELADS